MKKLLITIAFLLALSLCITAMVSCAFEFADSDDEKESVDETDLNEEDNTTSEKETYTNKESLESSESETEEGSSDSADSTAETVTESETETETETECVQELEFTKVEGGYSVSGYGTYLGDEVVIPSEYNGEAVISISANAFAGMTNITSVSIPEGVVSVGEGAFDGCEGIVSLTAPANLLPYLPKINLTVVIIIGDGIIPENAFEGCEGLESVVISEGITAIGAGAFAGCVSLEEINIPAGVAEIGEGAFDGCVNLSNITVDENNTAFKSVDGNLYDFNITVIIKVAGGRNLTSFTIPSTVITIAAGAFEGCVALRSVTIPDSVAEIGENAFYGCEALESIYIGAGIGRIGSGAFDGCPNINEVVYSGTVSDWEKIEANGTAFGEDVFKPASDCLIFEQVGEEYRVSGVSDYSVTDIVIPSQYQGLPVTSIGKKAFYDHYYLKSIIIPDSVTTINENAFAKCPRLESITLAVTDFSFSTVFGDTNTSLKKVTITGNRSVGSAFMGCTGITEVVVCEGITDISYGAFKNCTSLVSVTLPSTLKSLGREAFYNCTDLKIYIDDITTWCNLTITGFDNYPSCMNLSHADLYVGGELLTELVVPDGVTQLNDCVFMYCNSITSVYIPGSVKDIGYKVFYGCNNLKNITIENGIKYIDAYAFENCTSLVSIEIPESLEKMGGEILMGCSSLESLTIPAARISLFGEHEFTLGYLFGSRDTVANNDKRIPKTLKNITINGGVYIGENAFYNCTGIEKIHFGKTVKVIASSAFDGCTSLAEITVDENNEYFLTKNNCLIEKESKTLVFAFGDFSIPDDGSVIHIGEAVFRGCATLVNITLPDCIESIGMSAFYNCTNLESVTLPDSVKSIESYAFGGCEKLTSINLPDGIEYVGSDILYNCTGITCLEYDNAYYIGNENNPYLVLIKAKDTSITSCEIHADTKVISERAFADCASLEGIVIPDGVTSICNSVFSYCSALASITVPDSVVNWGTFVFSNCRSLSNADFLDNMTVIGESFLKNSAIESIVIPDSVTAIEYLAFGGCQSLVSVTLSENIKSIASYAFGDSLNLVFNEYDNAYYLGTANNPYYALIKVKDTSITSCEINPATKLIAGWAFSGCTRLESIHIPDSVAYIGEAAFYNCKGVLSITVGENNENFCAIDNCLIDIEGKTLIQGCRNSIIPDDGSVVYIGYAAFYGNTFITDLIIPEGIESIGDNAFYECKNIETVTIPNSLTHIGDYSFYNCFKIKEVRYMGSEEESVALKNSIRPGSGNAEFVSANAIYNYVPEESVPEEQ